MDLWLPLGASDFGRGSMNGVTIAWYDSIMLRALRILGRPARGLEDAPLADRLSAVFRHIDDAQGRATRTAILSSIVPAADSGRTQDSNALLGRLGGVAIFILAIACANVVNLLLARSILRRQEFAIRLAVGASRARLFRLLVVESVVLAALAGMAGLLAGAWTGDALRRLTFPEGRWSVPLFDARTLMFTGALAVIAGLAAGIVPAAQATRADLLTALKEGRDLGSARVRATRSVLVVLQTALSLAMLVASGLLVTSLVRLNAVPIGFDPRGLISSYVSAQSFDGHASAADLAARVPAGPRVAVALASIAPFGASSTRGFRVPGSSYEPESQWDTPLVMSVSPNYFSVLGTRVLQGRAFSDADTRGSEAVTIVNDTMARRYWGTTIPSGACILLVPAPCARVIGVVQDVRDTPGGAAAPMRFYLPLAQQDRDPVAAIVRVPLEDVPKTIAALRGAASPSQRVFVEIVADRVARATRPWRAATELFLALGGVALALACVGVYSVMNYVVSERRHELGVRVTLGATERDLVRLVLTAGLRLTIGGAVAGLAFASAAGYLLRALLFNVSPFSPFVYAIGCACLIGTASLAMLPPAWRAARLNPLAALRQE